MKKKIRKWFYGKCPLVKGSFPYYHTNVYFPENSHIFHLACDQGTYEHETVKLLFKLIKPHSYFFDVGANIGLISIPVLYQIESCHVVSFEPSPNTLPSLKRTAEESRFADRWHIIGKAVSDHDGEVSFAVASAALGAFDGMRDTKRAGSMSKANVQSITVNTAWEELKKPHVSVIKLDIEGAELLGLRGAQKCIEVCRPYILFEWNSLNSIHYGFVEKDLLCFVRDIHYRVFSAHSLIPVKDENDLKAQMLGTELFLLIPEVP